VQHPALGEHRRAALSALRLCDDIQHLVFLRAWQLGRLPIAEVGANSMGQFCARRDADGALRWWLTLHGKGGKERLVPATREMMMELSRYCQQLRLSALPAYFAEAGHAFRLKPDRCFARYPLAQPVLNARVHDAKVSPS
jgi:integrase